MATILLLQVERLGLILLAMKVFQYLTNIMSRNIVIEHGLLDRELLVYLCVVQV